MKLKLDGAYLPSFNKGFDHLRYQIKPSFIILGSAHNIKEIRIKEKQKVELIFISSIFKKNENYLGFYKFISLKNFTKKKVNSSWWNIKIEYQKIKAFKLFWI